MFPEIQKCVQMVLKTISGLYIFEVKQWQLSVSWNLTSFPKNLSLCYINLLYYINLFATVCPTDGKNISHIVMLEVNLLYRLITSMFSQQYPQLQSNMLIRSAKKRQEEEARTKRTNRMLIGMVSSDWWIAWTSGHVTAVLTSDWSQVVIFGTCWFPINLINLVADCMDLGDKEFSYMNDELTTIKLTFTIPLCNTTNAPTVLWPDTRQRYPLT